MVFFYFNVKDKGFFLKFFFIWEKTRTKDFDFID